MCGVGVTIMWDDHKVKKHDVRRPDILGWIFAVNFFGIVLPEFFNVI